MQWAHIQMYLIIVKTVIYVIYSEMRLRHVTRCRVRRASLCLEGAYVQETAQSTLNSALHHTYGYKQPAVLSLSGGMPAMTRDLVVYVPCMPWLQGTGSCTFALRQMLVRSHMNRKSNIYRRSSA